MYPTLEDIKLFLSNKPETGADWHELVPAYQRLCVDQLVLEIERLRHLTSRSSRAANACAECGTPIGNHSPHCPKYEP